MLYRLVSTRVHLGDFCLFTQTRSLPEGFTPLTMHVRHEDVQACEQGPSAFLLYTLILTPGCLKRGNGAYLRAK